MAAAWSKTNRSGDFGMEIAVFAQLSRAADNQMDLRTLWNIEAITSSMLGIILFGAAHEISHFHRSNEIGIWKIRTQK